jgi:hypothetical protein
MKVEGLSKSLVHEALLTHYLKHCEIYPCLGLFIPCPKLVSSDPEPLEDLRGDREVQYGRDCLLQQLIPRGGSRYESMFAIPVVKEHASLQDLSKDRSANAQVDVPQVQDCSVALCVQ